MCAFCSNNSGIIGNIAKKKKIPSPITEKNKNKNKINRLQFENWLEAPKIIGPALFVSYENRAIGGICTKT